MIGKITSEMISRRWALSLLGALGFVAAPTVLRPSSAKAQTAGAAPGRRKVALALQGGGSHGAFTWGVLDRLLGHHNRHCWGDRNKRGSDERCCPCRWFGAWRLRTSAR